MTAQERLSTIQDLQALQAANLDRDYELIAGVIYDLPTASPLHNAIVAFLLASLFNFVRPRNLGRVFGDRTGYRLDDLNEYIPDVSYVSYERQATLPDHFRIAPDLALEVISPSNSAEEIHNKTLIYFRYGTRLLWIVYPASRTLHETDTLDGGDVLPGFQLSIRDIFAEID